MVLISCQGPESRRQWPQGSAHCHGLRSSSEGTWSFCRYRGCIYKLRRAQLASLFGCIREGSIAHMISNTVHISYKLSKAAQQSLIFVVSLLFLSTAVMQQNKIIFQVQ